MQTVFIGVDVAKAELVISIDDQVPSTVKNESTAISNWLASLPQGACIAMESTGRYHQQLAHLAQHAGFTVYVLNARDVYFYAKALGARAKSDAVDCVVIRRYVQEHHRSLHPWQPGTKVQQQLHTLLTRRAQITAHQAAVRQTLKQVEMLEVEVNDFEMLRVSPILDDFEIESKEEIESIADRVAKDALIDRVKWRTCRAKITLDLDDVIRFSKENNIAPQIVAGRIRYETKKHWLFNELIHCNSVKKEIFNG